MRGVIAMAALAATTNHQPLFVVFGRPGSGKSTVADAAAEQLTNRDGTSILRLDLDVCVPEWMKDNFADGIYPTLEERVVFASDACDYVSTELEKASGRTDASLVSFSFVNEDIRTVFRERFPHSLWLLVDTDEAEANRRVMQRKDHFYKGKVPEVEAEVEPKVDLQSDNSDWAFAPVTFQHEIMDGLQSIDHNAKVVAAFVKKHLH